MPTITINTFGGEVPRTTPRLLENTQASVAVNCQLQRGALEPLREPGKIAELDMSSQSIFKHPSDGWLSWPGVVNVVKSAVTDVDGDAPLGHLFITGDRPYPTQYLGGGDVYRLGIPRPGAAPSISISKSAEEKTVACYAWGADTEVQAPPRYGYEDTLSGIQEDNVKIAFFAESEPDEESSSTDSGISRSSAYCYTLVQSLAGGIFRQESASSPASEVVDVLDGDGVTIQGFEIPELEGMNITHIRIYRTVSGSKTSEFHFLVEIALPVESYVDTIHDANISTEVLATSTWDCIPDDARGLIKADNGLYAAFRGNELLISEPFYAYVFPEIYRLTTEDTIVALGHVDGTIVVLTTGRPYLAAGQDPASLQITHLPIEQACVSSRSVGCLPGGVVYASPDGLMLFTSSNQVLLTEQTFTRDQWQAMNPSSILAAVNDGRYLAFFEGTNAGLLFSIGAKDVVRIALPDDWKVRGIYHHSGDDCVYLSVDTDNGSAVYQWEAGEPMPYCWRSKPFFSSTLISMSAVRVEGEQTVRAPLNVSVFGPDGERVRARLRLTDGRAKRLATTRSEKLWSVELRGTAAVYEARLGGSVEGVENGI